MGKYLTLRAAVVSLFLVGTSPVWGNPVGPGAHLINGSPVAAGTHLEVVNMTSQGSSCTATVIGPRVIITAAHCAITGQPATFKVGTVTYTATMTRSTLYPQKDHDIAVGVTSVDIQGVTPVLVGAKATTGIDITLFGYGCTNPGGGGGNDGILRMGDTVITGFSDYDMVSRKAGGAAVCFGDSGGPAMALDGTTPKLLGVNSKGNIQDTNYDTRTDIPETQTFLTSFAQTNNVVICGVTSDCTTPPPPPPTAPTCVLTASPSNINLGDTSTVSIVTTNATDAAIEGQSVSVPNGQMPFKPTAVGSVTVHGVVHGTGGTGNCQTTITVQNTPPPPPNSPSCTLTANPEFANIGDVVTLELDTQGNATTAVIDGTSVPIPVGKKMVTTTVAGTFTVNGVVSGPGGTGTCAVSYTVDSTPPPPPPGTPNFAVVSTYCGPNTLGTTVSKVCLAVVKRDSTLPDLRLTDVLLITYTDGSSEVAPIISRKTETAQPGDLRVVQDLTTYANTQISAGNYLVLDTRAATLTLLPPLRDGAVPASLQGRSPKGIYFTIDQLKPFGVSGN